MENRETALEGLLDGLSQELEMPHWTALVDSDGLVMACVPPDPQVEVERISAMTASIVTSAERLLQEIEGGQFRFVSVSGSKRKQLTIALSKELYLSIGLPPDVHEQATFKPVGRWGPEIVAALIRPFDGDAAPDES